MTPRDADPRQLRLWVALAFLVLGLALPWIFERAPDVLERLYVPWVFRPLAGLLGGIGSLVPISLAQLVVLAAVLSLAVLVVRHTSLLRRRGRRAGPAVVTTWIRILAVTVWSFHLVWGLHYVRVPFRERTGLPEVEVTPERIARLTRILAGETNHAHAMAVRMGELAPAADSSSTVRLERAQILDALAAGYGSVLPDTRGWTPSTPKFPEPAGWVLTRLGISGLYFPFTGEASVNGRMPAVAIPFVAAHEMAHQRGIAREDEANALAYLACRGAGLWVTRYSGALAAYRRAWVALYRAEPDSARALVADRVLEPGPLADQRAIQAFWMRHEGVASRAAETANDTYLKANAQRAGVASYGRMIDILVALEEIGLIAE